MQNNVKPHGFAWVIAALALGLFVQRAAAQGRVVAGEPQCNAEQGCYARFVVAGHDDIVVLAAEGTGESCLNLEGDCTVIRKGSMAIVNRAAHDRRICLAASFGKKDRPFYFCQDVPAESAWVGECDDCHSQIGGRLVGVSAFKVGPLDAGPAPASLRR